MPKFDSREEYENWKAQKALKRFGRAELDRSDQAWARKGPGTELQRSGRLWQVIILTILLGVLYVYARR